MRYTAPHHQDVWKLILHLKVKQSKRIHQKRNGRWTHSEPSLQEYSIGHIRACLRNSVGKRKPYGKWNILEACRFPDFIIILWSEPSFESNSPNPREQNLTGIWRGEWQLSERMVHSVNVEYTHVDSSRNSCERIRFTIWRKTRVDRYIETSTYRR